MELMPSEVTPEAARQSAARHFPDLADAWTLLLGGDGEGLRWSEADTLELVECFLGQAQQAGRPVLLASSRRTPPALEEAIRRRVAGHPGFVRGAWFHAPEEESPPLLAFIGAARRIVVTADSVSMTNEAVAAGAPTVAVYPRQGAPLARHRDQFALLREARRIAEVQLADAPDFGAAAPAGGWQPVTGDQHAALAREVLSRLGLQAG